jgi:hypothetical protein
MTAAEGGSAAPRAMPDCGEGALILTSSKGLLDPPVEFTIDFGTMTE